MNKNEMVSVSRETLERIIGCGKTGFPVTDVAFALLREILDMPAEQHQGDPVALPERKITNVLNYHAALGAEGCNACLDEIAKLGLLYTRPAPAVRKGEPVAMDESTEWKSDPVLGDLYTASFTAICPDRLKAGALLYTHADAGEVERLRTELAGTIAESERRRNCCADLIEERDALRAQLAVRDALLDRVVDHANFWHDHPYAEVVEAIARDYKSLSASAEPSAPKCGTCNDLGHVPDGEITDVGGVEFENGPVECLKDCPDCTPVERDGLEGVEDVAKSIGERMKSRAALERKS